MGKNILIVEDERDIALALREFFLSKGYEALVALTGEEAIRYLDQGNLDLILLDIQIPGINGIEILKEVKKRHPDLKTVVLTGFLEEYKKEIEQIGCDAFLSKPFSIKTVLKIVDSILIEEAELKRLREDEKESYFQTVLALAKTVDEKDIYTRGHLDEVVRYGMEVAEELSNSNQIQINMEDLKIALLLHDIGKIGVPDLLLNKKGSLTPDEWAIMRQHPEIGERIIEPVKKLKNVGKIIRHHQERFDGAGYPDGKKADEIPLESRIIAVVDAYHAMTSNRSYRKAMSHQMALEELKRNSGTQFDPVVVDAFLRAWEKGKIVRVQG